MPQKFADEYTSQFIISPSEAVAGTLVYEKLETGISVYDKVGWVLSRVEYRLPANVRAMFNGTGDYMIFGLSMSNQNASIADDDPAIITKRMIQRTDFGTAATGSIESNHWIDDYSTLPGGGILILPNPLYGYVQGSGLSSTAAIFCRGFVKAIPMSDQDYFNLVQARQLLIST